MRSLVAIALLAALAVSHAAPAAPSKGKVPEWLSTDFPLPLGVRSPQDLEFKSQAERQFLIFNLLAAGKVAYDQGDFVTAVARWETLLSIKGLETDLDRAVRPLLVDARAKAGSQSALPPPPQPKAEAEAAPAPTPERPKRPSLVNIEGVVSGGGQAGPGGAVVTLKRVDGAMPKLVPVRDRVVLQRGKQFQPRVVAIPVGSSLLFRNEDEIAHNVFSLSKPTPFDTGLYKAGNDKTQEFDKAGVVQLLCNIHSQMQAWVVVVDTPLYGQADGAGAFKIAGVPPGEYEVEVWHEFASKPTRQKVTIGKDTKLQLAVGGDRAPPGFVPDKYGKPRQTQLGY